MAYTMLFSMTAMPTLITNATEVTEITAVNAFSALPENAANTAQSQVYPLDSISSNTYSNETTYSVFISTDVLQEIEDSSGNVYAVYGTSNTVTLVPQNTAQDAVTIQNEGFTFGAATADENDHLYILWGKDNSDNTSAENILLCKYDLNGKLIASFGLPLEYTQAEKPFYLGNANIDYSNGVIGCFYITQWLNGHQGSEFVAVNAETMEELSFSDWQASHSLGLSMIPTDYGFAAVQRGDYYDRGLLFTTYAASSDEFNYLEDVLFGHKVIYHISGQYAEEGSHYNATHVYMGGLAYSHPTYAVAGKSERFLTSGNYAEYVKNHPDCGADIFDVFVRVFNASLDPMDELAGENRIDEETGEIADTNVIWLTQCNASEKVGSVKIVTMENGSYCVLWEKFVNQQFDSVRYVLMDHYGNITRTETEIQNARLSGTSIQPVVQGTTLSWAVADKSAGGIVWYTTDLEAFSDTNTVTLGDVNQDGEINAVDAADILKESALLGSGMPNTFTDAQKLAADVNHDDAVNAADAAVILQYATILGSGNTEITIEDLV